MMRTTTLLALALSLGVVFAGCAQPPPKSETSSDGAEPAAPVEAPAPGGNTTTVPTAIQESWTGDGGDWILAVQPLEPGSFRMDNDDHEAELQTTGDDGAFLYGPFLVLRDDQNRTMMPWLSTRADVQVWTNEEPITMRSDGLGSLESPSGYDVIAVGLLASGATPWTLDWSMPFNLTASAAGPLEVHRGTGATWLFEPAQHTDDPSAPTSQSTAWTVSAGVTAFEFTVACTSKSVSGGGCLTVGEDQQTFSFPGGVWECSPSWMGFTHGYFGHPAGDITVESSFDAPGYGYDYVAAHVPLEPTVLPLTFGHFYGTSGNDECKPDEIPA